VIPGVRGAAADPFAVLGLAPDLDLTDDDVRAAWRRIATACHPDRADGGDPGRFAAAAAAYTTLRTRSGRGEALADLAAAGRPGRARRGRRIRRAGVRLSGTVLSGLGLVRFAARIRDGRPWRLVLRAAAALAVCTAAAAVAGGTPAAPALITGALTWLIVTGRGDLAAAHRRNKPVNKSLYR
jgi:curved DNA-binding protein CbpA